jgi:hypothetical protein
MNENAKKNAYAVFRNEETHQEQNGGSDETFAADVCIVFRQFPIREKYLTDKNANIENAVHIEER